MRAALGVRLAFRRECRRIKARPFYLVWAVVAVAFSAVFFLTLMKQGLPPKLPVAVVDLDNSSLSRSYARNLDSRQQLDIAYRCTSYAEALDLMQQGKIYAFVVIPDNFQAESVGGRTPEIAYYINNSYLIAGSLTLKEIMQMNILTSGAMQQQVLLARGLGVEQATGIVQPIALDTHMIGNPWMNYGIYLINILLPGVLQMFVLMLSLHAIAMELKERTARTWLRTGGWAIRAALLGKLLPYTMVFSLVGIACDIVLYKLVGFPMNGSFGVMCLATVFLVIATQCVAVFIIGLVPSIRIAISMGGVYGLLGLTFAGLTFPVEGMPAGARIFSDLFPIRHYFRIYSAEALNGGEVWPWFLALAAFAILPLVVVRQLKRAALYS